MDLVTMILACSLYPNHSITNAIIELGSKNNPLAITNSENEAVSFKTLEQTDAYASNQIKQGHAVNIGLMQVSSRWLTRYQTTPAELTYPCKNMVVATKILNDAETRCNQLLSNPINDDIQACTLSIYKTGNSEAGLDYAHTIINYAQQHRFADLAASAEAKNPRGFHMIPGDAPTTAITINASKVNPATDAVRKIVTN